MGIKKLGLSFFVLLVFLSLNACVDGLTEYRFDSPSEDQGVAAQPPTAEPPQAEPTFPDPVLTPIPPANRTFGSLFENTDAFAGVNSRVEDLLNRSPIQGVQPNNPTTSIFPSLGVAGTLRSPIINQLPGLIVQQPQAPGPVETAVCDYRGEEGAKVVLTDRAMKNLAEDYCESFAKVVVTDSSSEECHRAVSSCVSLTRSTLFSMFDHYSNGSGCEQDLNGSPVIHGEDHYCCSDTTYNTVTRGIFYTGDAMRDTRELIHDTCS